MARQLNTRGVAARLSWQIIDKGQSLDAGLADYFANHDLINQDRGLVQELVYGICRWYGELDHVAASLLKKPIRSKDRVIHFVLLIGLYQLRHMHTAEHAAVAETVAACQQLNKVWAKNLINGCLRGYLRNQASAQEPADQSDSIQMNHLAHPGWMIDAIGEAWPDQLDSILAANNQRPPMCLRVNSRFNTGAGAAVNSRENYLVSLLSADIAACADPFSTDGIILEKPVAVIALPGFEEGAVSVQDSAAQLACNILDVHAGQSVLDACAAPGGKTAHILERTDNRIELHALDISERRCEQLHQTLARLQLNAEVFVADASKPCSWPAPENAYDRILIDAPCSGLGVIRRHPDIKHHRRVSDIVNLNTLQQQLLNQLWRLLKPGGLLLYMTCSVLPSENLLQIKTFLESHKDAHLPDFEHPHALNLEFGKQTLPGVHNMDGFYYCLIGKLDAKAS